MTVLSDAPVDGAPVRLFRPLLAVRRAETLAYCRELGLTPLQDETNADTRIARNLLRHDVVPLLERLNPRAVDALARLAETAGTALDFVEAALDDAWPSLATESDGAVTLDRERLRALHPALQGLAVRRAHRETASRFDRARRLSRQALPFGWRAGPRARSCRCPAACASRRGTTRWSSTHRETAQHRRRWLASTRSACPASRWPRAGGWRRRSFRCPRAWTRRRPPPTSTPTPSAAS